ncbi:protein required for attachment to host cells [Haloferula luteola]|uniref:Protein required for attachment to host cells n=1 Tax=Haloferula luteola TaxID=595692 RepID=A0A840UZ29_9BACT|nr:host attachment protein [Haloferula luteola]MBB5351032.1 protein required for attachment to host cells [Haloferula luteola]
MKRLLIVADLGRMKAYRISKDDDDPTTSPAFEDLKDIDLENRHSRVSDRFTYQAGRMSHGPGGNSVGERHREQAEVEGNQLLAIAGHIDAVAQGADETICLAAPKTILAKLRDSLSAGVRQRIVKDLPLDLVKVPKRELLQRFELA